MESLLSLLRTVRWQDIADILLNSYILYRLFVLFRGTAVWRVLVGIALLLLVKSIAEFLCLIITSWAIQGITAAALIIIVVFRNEIAPPPQKPRAQLCRPGGFYNRGHTVVHLYSRRRYASWD